MQMGTMPMINAADIQNTTFLTDTPDMEPWPSAARLRQARVNEQILSGDAARFVGREEERGAADVFFGEPELEALRIQKRLLLFRCQPQRFLPLGDDGAGNDRVDANVVHAKLARERAREAADRRFRRRIRSEARDAAHPRDRAEVDDRSAARAH